MKERRSTKQYLDDALLAIDMMERAQIKNVQECLQAGAARIDGTQAGGFVLEVALERWFGRQTSLKVAIQYKKAREYLASSQCCLTVPSSVRCLRAVGQSMSPFLTQTYKGMMLLVALAIYAMVVNAGICV
jgi:hypothetical protein